MFNLTLNGNYAITEEPNFHLLDGESVHSMLPLANNKFLCSVFSGTLQLLDVTAKTVNVYANKHKGSHSQCLVPFPEFHEDNFPLVLVKEWECVVLFNIKLKEYIKICDIDTTNEEKDNWCPSN